jgi:hypothetical protein
MHQSVFLPPILNFVRQFTWLLVEKINTVHYTDLSRKLKVAEEYALRLRQAATVSLCRRLGCDHDLLEAA